MERSFNYFAFISYNSKDTEWGKRLQRKLEHYPWEPNRAIAMKKYCFLSLFLIFVLAASAQRQQGFVETQGLANKPGEPLAGVTIRWRGAMNAVLSGQDGKFSVSFVDKNNGDAISLLSVSKKDYELLNPDMLKESLVFSTTVPIEIVMVDSKVLEANKRRISNNAYRKAEETYQNKKKILEQQLAEHIIREEQYRQQLLTLQDNYERYINMIEGMAERYARTDYDHLDSLDREINICIENGDLDKADSLIHTVFDPTTVLERNRAAKQAVLEKMRLAQEIIDKAHADREALCRDADYAKRVVALCDKLAAEYLEQGDKENARECLMQSLTIRQLLYGDECDEVKEIKRKIETIR